MFVNTDGSFAEHDYEALAATRGIAAADFDDDGAIDLAVGDRIGSRSATSTGTAATI